MTPERAELDRDTSGFSESQLAPFLQEALDELIDRLFNGKKVGRFGLDAYIEQFAEEIASKVILAVTAHHDFIGDIPRLLERLIRRELEDSDEVRELAAELAYAPNDQ